MQVPRSAMVLSASLVATASAAIYIAQLHVGSDSSSTSTSTSSRYRDRDPSASSASVINPSSSTSSASSALPLMTHIHQQHTAGIRHGPATLQDSHLIVSRNEFYAWIREWIVLFIVFLCMYALSYSVLEWLRWKVHPTKASRGSWKGVSGTGGFAVATTRMRQRRRSIPIQQRDIMMPSFMGIEEEQSDYTRKRRRISSAASNFNKRMVPTDPRYHRHQDDEDQDEESLMYITTGVDQLVTMVICAVGLAVAQGAFLMLPTTMIVTALFASFGQQAVVESTATYSMDSLYLGWLDLSLLHNSAKHIALLTDVAMFLLVPFAFFYHEQAEMLLPFTQRRRGSESFWPKAQSALVGVVLVNVLYVSGVWAVKNLWLGIEQIETLAVIRVSRVVLGWAGFVALVPLGMMHLFRLAATLPVRMGARQYAEARLAQLECEHAVWIARLEDKEREIAKESSLLSSTLSSKNHHEHSQPQSNNNNLRKRSFVAAAGLNSDDQTRWNPFSDQHASTSRYDLLSKLRLLDYEMDRLRKELYVSPWKRNAAFFGLLIIALAIYGRLLVLLAKSLVFGRPVVSSSPTIPIPSVTNAATLLNGEEGEMLATLPIATMRLVSVVSPMLLLWDVTVDIFWIMIVMALALFGLYHHPYYRKVRLRHARTSALAMIANVPIVLTLATSSWSLMVDCLGLLHSPPVWAVRGAAVGCSEEDQTRKLLWDSEAFDQVLGDKRSLLEILVRTSMFVLLSILGAQWIVHRLIRLQSRR